MFTLLLELSSVVVVQRSNRVTLRVAPARPLTLSMGWETDLLSPKGRSTASAVAVLSPDAAVGGLLGSAVVPPGATLEAFLGVVTGCETSCVT